MSSVDSLADFRRKLDIERGIVPPENAGSGAEAYEAFHVVDRRQLRLQIQPARGPWEWLPYGYLLRVMLDGRQGTEIILVFTFLAVIIRGRNLAPLADAISKERCEFVRQFDAKQWARADDGAPVVEHIEIHADKPPGQVATENARV
jgi:hypothetical protein